MVDDNACQGRQLLNTSACLKIARFLHEFENNIFGVDFACSFQKVQPWLHSGDLFYSAIVDAQRRQVLSIGSIIVVTQTSRDALLAGACSEVDLVPFSTSGGGDNPVFYYSSLVVTQPMDAVHLLRSLHRDLSRYCAERLLRVRSVFSIPIGDLAITHLVKSGFTPSAGRRYLEKYTLYQLDRAQSRTRFWMSLLT